MNTPMWLAVATNKSHLYSTQIPAFYGQQKAKKLYLPGKLLPHSSSNSVTSLEFKLKCTRFSVDDL